MQGIEMESDGLYQLPNGWVWTKLGDIVASINPGFPSGKHNQEGRGIPHIRPMNISIKGEIDLSDVKYVEVSEYNTLLAGDVLFNNTNSTELLGKTTVIGNDTKWAYSNHMTRIRLPKGFLNSVWIAKSIHYLFLTGYFKMNCTHHVNQASINKTFLAERVYIPLPPLPEQHRIVEKIEELFTRLDAGVKSLKKAKEQLRHYRQAVLKYAFEGKLTEEWRKANKDKIEPASVLLERIKDERKKKLGSKYKEMPPVDTSELHELPDGWVWTKLENITEIILGQSPPSSTYNENGEGLPFYQGKLEFGKIFPSPQKWCKLPKKIAKKGDVLISVRAPVGPTNICPEKSCIGRGLAAIRGLSGINTYFILYVMRTFEKDISEKGIGTTFAAITGNELRQFVIPFPPLFEQHRIIEEIELRLSVADEVENVIDTELKRAERLRQSILKQAFSGKLVPQDLTDEPASVLLERIRAEKEKHSAKNIKNSNRKSKKETEQMRLF